MNSTPQTPLISFNAMSGIMEIRGRSIPDDPDAFWIPVLNWFESYLLHPNKSTVVKIDLEYFNISSSKRILFLLYKLNELFEADHEVFVEWSIVSRMKTCMRWVRIMHTWLRFPSFSKNTSRMI